MDGEAKKRCFVFLGPPGSGKGTQAEVLAKELGVPTISTGEMLRGAVAAGSDLGERVGAVMASGALVEDDMMADVVRARLRADDTAEGFFLDGYPRTTVQAGHLDGILSDVGGWLAGVVFVDVPEDELVRRALARKRADDRPEIIRERLRVYHEQTEPLVSLYRARGVLNPIDGNQGIDEVSESIRGVLQGAMA